MQYYLSDMNCSTIGFYLVKIIYIFLLGNIYLFFGTLMSYAIYKYISRPYDQRLSKLHNIAQLVLETGLIMVSVYFIRLTIKVASHPLDGLFGFQHKRVKELGGSVILAFAFLIYMKERLANKITQLYGVQSIGAYKC